uniref:Trafficking protein particle complex subunit n=1 Tax=Salix viminalis TaxID=40686 RepID=A0A6N2N6Q7_SALVM
MKFVQIILITHPKTGDLRESLKYIYNLYVEYVVKNPIYTPGAPIRCELFNTSLDQYVRSISYLLFKPRPKCYRRCGSEEVLKKVGGTAYFPWILGDSIISRM